MQKCLCCGKQFEYHQSNPNKRKTKYCSNECSIKSNQQNQSKKRKKLNLARKLGLSGGVTGKINENIVAIDLLKKGFSVYLAYEDTHPLDLLAIKDNQILKIEVKTGIVLPSGLITYAMKKSQNKKHDILAVVTNLNDIKYNPPFLDVPK